MGQVQAPKKNNPRLSDRVQLTKGDIFWPEGPWYFVRGEMVWSKTKSWKEFYEGNREDCYFETAEEAMEGWENSAE